MSIEERLGRCYELTYKCLVDHSGTYKSLIHGYITNKNDGTKIDHAWLLTKEVLVYDVVLDTTFEEEIFKSLYNPETVKVYSLKEAIDLVYKHKVFGPWHKV